MPDSTRLMARINPAGMPYSLDMLRMVSRICRCNPVRMDADGVGVRKVADVVRIWLPEIATIDAFVPAQANGRKHPPMTGSKRMR